MKNTLEIRINRQVVDQGENLKGTFERLNPYLTYEAKDFLTDTANIPILPNTPTNRAIFGYIDLPALGSDVPRFDFEQYINGYLVFEGMALLTDVGSQGYTLKVVQPVGEFFGDYQRLRLTDIDFGTASATLPLPAGGVIQDAGQNAVCFPTIINTEYLGTNGASVSYSGKVNDYASGAYTASSAKVPMIFLKYVLRKIATMAGVTIDGAFMSDADTDSLILYNIRALDGATVVTINRHLPEMTIVELIVELRKYLNLSFKFDTLNKRLTIGYTDSIFSQPCLIDFSEKLVLGARKILERSRRLRLSMELDSNDALQKDRPAAFADYLTPAFADDLAIATLTTKFSTLALDAGGLPAARQQGATTQFAQLDKKSTPRLLHWQGIQAGFPTATPTKSGKSLFWNGPMGCSIGHGQKPKPSAAKSTTSTANCCLLKLTLPYWISPKKYTSMA